MVPIKFALLPLAILLIFSKLGSALECYVCTDQEDNIEKCLNTIKTCEQGEDVCLSEIRWGSTPYWQQGAKKQYYISKRCSTKAKCHQKRELYMPFCTHIWYQDWSCSECCQGDRCNYFVINSSTSIKPQGFLAVSTVFAIYHFILKL